MAEEEVAPVDIDLDAPIAVAFNRAVALHRRKKLKTRKKHQVEDKAASDGVAEGFTVSSVKNRNEGEFAPGITVSLFDYSVANHFKAVDSISRLCGLPQDFDPAEIRRLSPSIIFLREWRQFAYPSKTLRFLSQNQSKLGRDFVGAVTLPQFSSAAVPKKGAETEATSESSKDFVMHVGGLVSALDWCPRVHSHSNSDIGCEFIAVAAHPPESYYHKIGAPLMGRGMVQVWCVINLNMKKGMPAKDQKKQKRSYTKKKVDTKKSPEQKRPRGRPRKHPVDVNNDSDEQLKPRVSQRRAALRNNQIVETPAVPHSKVPSTFLSVDVGSSNKNGHLSEDSAVVKEVTNKVSLDKSHFRVCRKLAVKGRTKIENAENASPVSSLDENAKLPSTDSPAAVNFPDTRSCQSSLSKCSISNDVALPRLVLCLAHNGKVAWDVKWRPSDACDKQRMGYLAVLLGNGALEVWEVPFPQTVKVIYSDSRGDTTDPRFIKLQPVFRCSIIKCGDRQSIPLSIEWSASSPHDKILAGCHDGVVALWKFCGTSSLEETRPLLCFSADTAPIRALSWAPVESSSESSNIVVTGGHKGLKFWDLRDPFRPLWELNPIQQIVYSLDWLPDPRCILVAFDDGALRILSMSKAACDLPVTGKPFAGTQQQGFHTFFCSQYPIWSVHISRLTGMVAYCGADGTALRFQLSTRAVEGDTLRNRAPHFLCGMLTEEEDSLTMYTPLPDVPFPMKKSDNEWAEKPSSKRGAFYCSSQEKTAKETLENVEGSDVQPIALCYGSDSGLEFGSNDKLPSVPTGKQAVTKTKSHGKRKLSENSDKEDQRQQLLLCGVESPEIERGGVENEGVKKFEELPPKVAAMHRVRWNVNVGSENWLCYGGAAGVLRCQEML